MLEQTGYKRRTFEEILVAKIAKAKEIFGEEINTDENTALGKYIRINAYDQYYVEQAAEQIYYSIFPQTASGQALDMLGWSVGIKRNVATPSKYSVLVKGTAGGTIEYGFLVGTIAELNFYNTKEAVISEDGTCTIIVECVETGTIGNVLPSEITRVVNPSAFIDSVEGISVYEMAIDEESDSEFVKRYETIGAGKGGCTEESIISALTNIPTVRGAYIDVNESTDTVNGVPPKSIVCYVDGGENYIQEIGEAIFSKKPIGVGTHGDKSVTVSYGGLKDYEIKFSSVACVDVYVKLQITTNAEFETSGAEKIRMNIESYINNLGIGKTLVTTALYRQIYGVVGVESAIAEVSINGEGYSSENVEVEPYARCSFKQIIINDNIV